MQTKIAEHKPTEIHLPASIDSDRENVVVESLFNHADNLCVCGYLSALQTLKAKQRDGGH